MLAKSFTEVSEEKWNKDEWIHKYLIDDDVTKVIENVYPDYKWNKEYPDNIAHSFFTYDMYTKERILKYDDWGIDKIIEYILI